MAGIQVATGELVKNQASLKPCPWCGKTDELFVEDEFVCFYVKCRRCVCRGPEGADETEAKNLWNKHKEG